MERSVFGVNQIGGNAIRVNQIAEESRWSQISAFSRSGTIRLAVRYVFIYLLISSVFTISIHSVYVYVWVYLSIYIILDQIGGSVHTC